MKEEFTDARTDERTDGRTHDGHNAMTMARWPSASGAKNEIQTINPFSEFYLPEHGTNCVERTLVTRTSGTVRTCSLITEIYVELK